MIILINYVSEFAIWASEDYMNRLNVFLITRSNTQGVVQKVDLQSYFSNPSKNNFYNLLLY